MQDVNELYSVFSGDRMVFAISLVEELLIKCHIPGCDYLIEVWDPYAVYVGCSVSNEIPNMTPRSDFEASPVSPSCALLIQRVCATAVGVYPAPIRS